MLLAHHLWHKPGNFQKNSQGSSLESERILLLHGMGGTGSIWRPLAASLEEQLPVLALDQRGHGKSRVTSGRTAPEYTPLAYGRDVVETLDQLNFHPTWVVGHSMGVRTACATAHLRPEWIRGLILVDLGFSGVAGGGLGENLARFIRPGVVMATSCSDPADPNHKVCADNLQRLRQTRDAAGRELEIIEVEQPRPRFDAEGRRLALAYTNFYTPNGAVIIPAFEDGPADKRAYDIAARVFTKREIVQLPAIELAFGGGGIHSICLPQPAGHIAKPL